MKLFAEDKRVEKAGVLGDVFGGVETARLHLKEANAVAIVIELGAGTATDFQMTLRQHDAAAAGNSLDLVSSVPVYHKVDADAQFTRLDVEAANNAIASLDTDAGTVIVEVYTNDLDDGFEYISLDLPASGSARVASVEYIVDTKNKPAYQVAL